MKYLEKAPFTLPAGPGEGRITGCERCCYGTGVHEWWCPVWKIPPALKAMLADLDALDAILREN